MNICFIDYTPFKYSHFDKDSPLLRGAETTIINLSHNLSLLDNNVYIFNNCSHKFTKSNLHWDSLDNIENCKINFDIAIANGDIRLLNKISAKKKFAISYSVQNLEKFIRKKQLKSFIINKPKIILIGKYHKNKRNFLTRIFGYDYLDLAVDENFISTRIDLNGSILNNQAIFTSRGDRNGPMLFKIWKDYINSVNKNVKLLSSHIENIESPNKFNVFFRELKNQKKLIEDLKKSRMMLVPGHKAELFCLAAEEAKELCVPIVTLGIGSLKERVTHGVTGFVAKNYEEFSFYALKLFEDSKLWNEIRKNLFNQRNKMNWKISAQKFLKVLNS